MKEKTSLDMFDMSEYPKDLIKYLKNYGFHFNKKAFEEAVKGLKRKNLATGKLEPVEAKTKEEVEQMLAKYNVKLEDNVLYDHVWAYNMIVSDYWKSAIDDEQHLAKAVKDVIDDPDQRDGYLFNRWISDRLYNGNPIEWSELI